MTLMINGYKPKDTIAVLEKCFVKGQKPFGDIYEELKTFGKVSDGNQVR